MHTRFTTALAALAGMRHEQPPDISGGPGAEFRQRGVHGLQYKCQLAVSIIGLGLGDYGGLRCEIAQLELLA